jgi:hypothetical protein
MVPAFDGHDSIIPSAKDKAAAFYLKTKTDR